MKKYNNPIYYIGTAISSSLMTIRTYIAEYESNSHYECLVYSFNLQEIVNTFNYMRNEFIKIRSSIPSVQSLPDYQKILEELKSFNPNIPIEK